jgi:membrane protease YdiL (CAAX protease family)
MMDPCTYLGSKPSPIITRRLLVGSAVFMVAVYAVMTAVYVASGDRVNMASSQLSFSAAFLQWQYSQMTAEGLAFYGFAQQIDYIFMGTYAMFTFSACLTMARTFPHESRWHRAGLVFAVLGLVAASCDAIENAFIFLTLSSNPSIPPWQAVGHSLFASVKWGLLLAVISWLVGAAIKCRVLQRHSR